MRCYCGDPRWASIGVVPLGNYSNLIGIIQLVGGVNPSEKYESQWEGLFPIYEKNVPNHQPVLE